MFISTILSMNLRSSGFVIKVIFSSVGRLTSCMKTINKTLIRTLSIPSLQPNPHPNVQFDERNPAYRLVHHQLQNKSKIKKIKGKIRHSLLLARPIVWFAKTFLPNSTNLIQPKSKNSIPSVASTSCTSSPPSAPTVSVQSSDLMMLWSFHTLKSLKNLKPRFRRLYVHCLTTRAGWFWLVCKKKRAFTYPIAVWSSAKELPLMLKHKFLDGLLPQRLT